MRGVHHGLDFFMRQHAVPRPVRLSWTLMVKLRAAGTPQRQMWAGILSTAYKARNDQNDPKF